MTAKLDAINVLLKAIGESPVNSLASGLEDAATAVATLDLVKNRILTKGWHFNTDEDVELVPDINQEIRIPSVLRIDTSGFDRWKDVTVRVDPEDELLKLFNRKTKTFKFTQSVKCDLIKSFEFDDLPFDLQTYVTAQAARQFQQDTMGSVALDKFLVRSESEAWASFQDSEAEVEDANTLTDSPHAAYITRRNSRIRGF